MADMTGQVAVVTGGARGIGKAISERLAGRGMKVAVGYSSGRDTAAELAEKYPGMTIHQGNIGSREDCERVVQEVYDEHGRIDVLVNNAGITADKMLHKMEVDDWDKVIQVNLSGTFYMAHMAYQHMRERGSGRIISISSVIGESGNAGQANYAATKAGLFGLTFSLAKEAATHGITVNCVAPGYIETDLTKDHLGKDGNREALENLVPAQRLGVPEEVADAVTFLASDRAGFITGQILYVDDGRVLV